MSLDLWNKLRTPPPTALKPISGGRLNGKTDINPMWRLQALTEQFGPCGVGWRYEITNVWMVDASEGQKILYMQVHLFIKENGEWSAPIPGFGGDFMIEKERAGLHANDEAFKMAETDALGNAMKKLGQAADVYWAAGKESKYDKQPTTQQPAKPTQTVKPPITDAQRKKMFAMTKDAGITGEQMKEHIHTTYQVQSSNDLTQEQAKEVINWLDKQIIERKEKGE
jgi:hypothetical protein